MQQQIKLQNAEQITSKYLKPLYSFSLKRAANLQDAEDLTHEISIKLFETLLAKNDIEFMDAFVWKIAHNVFSNYYRKRSRHSIGLNIDDLAEILADQKDLPEEKIVKNESRAQLQKEIAYLSKLQRKILIYYYYSGKKQSEIADLLDVPIGTVKWHLFEAKSKLKKGMETMRESNDLKFNPIKFGLMGTNGSVGTMGGTKNFFRSTLSQNIIYSIYKESKTINEIADNLGVSPVYVESDLAFLEEYDYILKQQGNKFIANALIDEPSQEMYTMHSQMYEDAVKLISNEIFDKLFASDILSSSDLYYPNGDKNFFMWTLTFYVLANSMEGFDHSISFEEAATLRKDGGHNIAYLSIEDEELEKPKYYEHIQKMYGPMWNGSDHLILWQINSEWSNRTTNFDTYSQNIDRDLNLLERFTKGETLSKEEYAFMAEKGYIKGCDTHFELDIVWIKNNATKLQLIDIGNKVKKEHTLELKTIKQKYVNHLLNQTPKHLRKMQGFGMQQIFYADGWFLLYSLMELLQTGRLKPVLEEQRKPLTTLILSNLN